ncbi:MAG TPA: tryptophan-rich sensory protein [Candidatus Binatia bacterium]|nr:tryptophan-rich sensory protein [Candidatus Binatia bacterium]
MNVYIVAGLVCAAFALLEGMLAGRGVSRFMHELKQPRWSLPSTAWYAIGLLYYGACYVVLLPALRNWHTARTEFWLLITIMAMNADWNYFFFRRRDFKKSFRATIFYSAFVVILLWRLFAARSPSSWVFLGYALYLPYSCAWTYQVWKLNAEKTIASSFV